MTATAWLLVGVAAVVAIADWVAVHLENRPAEYVLKPATMVPLIAAAAVLHPASGTMRWLFVAGLVMSLAGDVFLMLPDAETFFVPGLASFLVGHVLYISGLLAGGESHGALVVGAVCVALAMAVVAPRIVTAARATDRRLAVPVAVYILAISIMVACAIGSTVPAAIAGALLFYLSDFTIGWSRFVADFPRSNVVIITTYHVAQILLVVSLAVAR